MKLSLLAVTTSLLVGLSYGEPVSGQYMFLDTNGDGIQTEVDGLSAGDSWVDIWLQTDVDHSGAQTSLRDASGKRPSINSYEFILRVFDGEIDWGEYANFQPTMTVPFGPRHNKTDFYHGYVGLTSLPAGKYKLGRLGIRVLSGRPRLEFAALTPLWGVARTSFGSKVPGVNGDHTLKLGEMTPAGVTIGHGRSGDWADASGLTTIDVASSAASFATTTESGPRFVIRVSPNPWNGPGRIEVQTSRVGRLRVQVFDLAGRLVRTVVDEASVEAGRHAFAIDTRAGDRTPMAAGVYFYRVDASEGLKRGRIVVLGR